MIIVQKYGGATLETSEKIKNVAIRIAELKKQNHKVVVVVSAMGSTTNQLIELAKQVSPNPLLRELDMLLSTGERISMSLMSMALNDQGHQAISLTGSQAGILTDDSHVNAMITDVKAHRVLEALNKDQIVILAGFQGVNPITKEITTLGRGGSDTTAVAMSAFLNANHCEILKDVPSIFTADPKLVAQAKPIKELNYDILLEMTLWGAKVLHHRSVQMAKDKNVTLYVGPASHSKDYFGKELMKSDGTWISADKKFIKTQPIAVNSYDQILVLKFKQPDTTQNEQLFNDFLKKKNIGTPQILFMTAHNQMYVSGPKEILEQILHTLPLQNEITLDSSALSSVSLTCSGIGLQFNEIEKKALALLSENQIQPHLIHRTELSVHFFVTRDKKNQVIQLLHNLIP